MTTLNGSFSPSHFKKCIELKVHIISSDAFINFVQTVAGENTNVSKDFVGKEFVDEVLQIVKPYLNKPNGITIPELIDLFKYFPIELKQYLTGRFVDKPLNNIENSVEETRKKRTEKVRDAEKYGKELYNNTKVSLQFLKNILGENNVQYQVLVNKVAQEVLQCAIDFFIHYRDDIEYDPGEESLLLIKVAKSVQPTGQVKSRIDENIDNTQKWIEDCKLFIDSFILLTPSLSHI